MSSDNIIMSNQYYTQPYLTNDNQLVYPITQPYYVYTTPQQNYMPVIYTNTYQFNPTIPTNNDIENPFASAPTYDNTYNNNIVDNKDEIEDDKKGCSKTNIIATIAFIVIVIFTAVLLILKHVFHF